MMDNFTQNDL